MAPASGSHSRSLSIIPLLYVYCLHSLLLHLVFLSVLGKWHLVSRHTIQREDLIFKCSFKLDSPMGRLWFANLGLWV